MQPAATQLAEKLQRALVLQQQGDLARARYIYEKILKAQPRHVTALNRLGVIAAQTDDFNRALYLFDKAIEIDPANAVAHGNRGLALHRLEQLDAALASYDRALAIEPDKADAHMNRGNVLKDLGQWEAALEHYDRAIKLKPDYAEAFSNSGYVLKELKRVNEALARYARAIAIDPGYVNAHCNRAFTLLSAGDLEHGWAEYEWRRKLERSAPLAQPDWLGEESIAGKTILLHGEQGLGDTLQFCRYAKLVADLGARVLLEVQKPLKPLLDGLAGVSQVIATGSALPQFDFRCSLMSLPLAFGTRLDTIPFSAGYLRSDAAKVASWRERLGERARPRIGLVWSGSRTHSNDRFRSVALAQLMPHLPAELQYICLQTDVRDADRQTLRANPHIIDPGDERRDFSDTAALAECMDVIIGVDTSVVHLGGALGKATWILLPSNADWRWLLDRRDSPWYSQVKLYRQDRIGDWNGVFAQLERDLSRLSGSQ
jgi:tetratricopeptide (TPR) repeat protein